MTRPGAGEGRMLGPAERALARLVEAPLAAVFPGAAVDAVTVQTPPQTAIGDLVVDLRPVLGHPPERAECQAAAEALGALDGVDAAVAVPPRVYVRPGPALLHALVVPEVRASPTTYGGSDEHKGRQAMVSFSDPNLNKPLHVGHLRNNFLGMAIAGLIANQGYEVERNSLHSNWGIHICQALAAYVRWGEGQTPESAGVKSDHFVGSYYQAFHRGLDEERRELGGGGPTPLEREAAEILRRMETGDEEARALNDRMTRWAEDGIVATYGRIGTRLDVVFPETETWPAAKEVVAQALADGRLLRREDGSVCADLSHLDLPQVTIMRGDGTPLVYGVWLGIDTKRFRRQPFDKTVQVSGAEWEGGEALYRQAIKRLGFDWLDRWELPHHGMVRLPEGKMRSRQGTVVTADDFLDRVRDLLLAGWGDAAAGDERRRDVCDRLGVALVKYVFLRARRVKDIVYDEDLLWERGLPTFSALVRTLIWAEQAARAGGEGVAAAVGGPPEAARALLLHLNDLPRVARKAFDKLEPAHVVAYLDDLARLAAAARRHEAVDRELAEAVAVAARRALAVVNVELPPLDDVPPPFSG